MRKFRVAKFLEDGRINEYAVYDNGRRRKIITNEKYGKYFHVDNELHPDEIEPRCYFFTGERGKNDAVEMVKRGNGDYISIKQILNNVEVVKVLYFLDRKIGEEMRKKTLEIIVKENEHS